ncbi:E3 ubiquitin-protein ligase KCMF1 isoform X2 [Culex pipiens pallens]|uniref:E3 ubiquitin-protein ligase KCMF1 isoform X2 n=1 Tax=Culex pipiens pallens TaxID=42434 RepID=UPI001954CBF0|nr:E3 ubiquitin-protein ligase KCMF1 isoform X2 [Culex pipiens pallens]
MSRHEGVSCDSCLKSNFRGRRYKCLICYDYDLCAICYEEGATSTRHSADHPMQCILTRSDFELYYGGEVLTPDQPQSFTCPYCKRMGLSDSALLEHVSSEHTDTGLEVVCPVCAALPGGDPNLVTDDFAGHLSLEHRSGSRDLISFLDEPSAIRHGGVRRMPHSGRALGGPRSRRSNMHFSSSGGGLSALSPSGRESVDPIAELLQQLSSVRRGGAPQPSQLQQLQMQIQLERQQVTTNNPMNHGPRIRRSRFDLPSSTSSSLAAAVLARSRRSEDEIRSLQQAARQQLERLPRRQQQPVVSSATNATGGGSNASASGGSASTSQQSSSIITLNAGGGGGSRDAPIAPSSSLPMVSSGGLAACNILGGVSASAAAAAAAAASATASQQQSQFLMARFMVPSLDDAELAQLERDRADRSQFVQSLMLSTIANVQAFSKNAESNVTDELNLLNLGNINNSSSLNRNTKKCTGDADEQQQQDGAANNNNGKDEGNCDNLKQVDSDSGAADELQNLHPPQVLSRVKGKSSSKPGSQGGGGGGGGCIDRRPRQQQQQQQQQAANSAKAREMKQANSSANTPSSMSSKHMPDPR